MNESVNSQEIAPTAQGSSETGISYYQDWLKGQQRLIAGLQTALVMIPESTTQGLFPVAKLNIDSEYYSPLLQLTQQEQQYLQPEVCSLSSTGQGEVFALLYPLRHKEHLIGVVIMAVEAQVPDDLSHAITILQWSVAGLEVIDYQHRFERLQRENAGVAQRVDVLARVLCELDYASAAVRLVTELAVLFNCDRVSLGEFKKNRSRLKHLSHSTQFGKRMNLVRCIEQVMDEAIDQNKMIRFPVSSEADEGEVMLAHRYLSEQQGDACILSIPVFVAGQASAALVLEGNPDVPFSTEQAQLCQSIASLVMPALEDKRLNDRALWRKCFDVAKLQLGRLLGAGYLGRKLFLIGLITLVYFLTTATGEYRLSAQARLYSATQRAVVAPFDGYIQAASARAGDRVDAQQVLINLDDRDLRLERLKWLSEEAKLKRQYQEALSARDRSKINIINAQSGQVEAQLALVASQLERAKLIAPFAGLVISGDLSQRLGAAVSKGEELLAVAPSNQYRIRLLIQENRIADLKLGQQGTLYLSALPETPFAFNLSKVTPLIETKDGASYFIAEGELQTKHQQLQPGMEGIGKVLIDERKRVSIWSREAQAWLRLKAWSWWG